MDAGREDFIAFIEKQIEYGRNLSRAIADVAYVLMSNCGSTSDIALLNPPAVAGKLRDALTEWFCRGPEEQVRRMKEEAARGPRPGTLTYTPPASVERLAMLIKRRDELQEMLDQYNDVAEKAANMPGGEVMAQYMRVVNLPVKQELERIEADITEVQRTLESAE